MHGYAEILRNVLACRGIKCIILGSDTHAYNQVNIGGKWYYVDLTLDRDSIKNKQVLRYCLLSKKEFEDCKAHETSTDQIKYPSDESYYIKGENGEFYKAGEYYKNMGYTGRGFLTQIKKLFKKLTSRDVDGARAELDGRGDRNR